MREYTVGKNLTAGTANTLYTVPRAHKAIATLLFIAHGAGSTASISAAWYDTSEDSSVTILAGKNLGAGEFIQFSDGRLVLDEGDSIIITPASGSTFSAILTVELVQSSAYQNGV